MKMIVVISLDIDDAEQIPEVLRHLDPPAIPHFDGQIRVAIDEAAIQVIDWLEGDDEAGPVIASTPR